MSAYGQSLQTMLQAIICNDYLKLAGRHLLLWLLLNVQNALIIRKKEPPVLLAKFMTMMPQIKFAVGRTSWLHCWTNPNFLAFLIVPETLCLHLKTWGTIYLLNILFGSLLFVKFESLVERLNEATGSFVGEGFSCLESRKLAGLEGSTVSGVHFLKLLILGWARIGKRAKWTGQVTAVKASSSGWVESSSSSKLAIGDACEWLFVLGCVEESPFALLAFRSLCQLFWGREFACFGVFRGLCWPCWPRCVRGGSELFFRGEFSSLPMLTVPCLEMSECGFARFWPWFRDTWN